MKPAKIFFELTFILIFIIALISVTQANPIISQDGNLLDNGNFESGVITPVTGTGNSAFTSWNQWQQPSNADAGLTLTTQQVTSPLIEGNYTAYISGNHDDGLFQYNAWSEGTYTLSGWVYVVSGAAHLGLAWDNGHEAAYSSSSSTLNQWIFLQLTMTVPSSFDGPLVYAAINDTEFYAEGLWLNTGSENNSPFQPDRFAPVPLPAAFYLFGLGMIWLIGLRRKFS
ncbi:MAG: hypothetical protein A4E66_00478 [Syntrophus sp. PtaB.Bin001]|nr:MAG: hypothetical protein A4E66_00478 [Syntrophus sp. PtaB.Bin001]